MKKVCMFLVFILCFGMTCWAETGLETTLFTGFEAQELTSEEVELISGGETYVGYTPVIFGCYHTLTVVTDKPISDPTFEVLHVFESGAGSSSSGSSSSWGIGYNVEQHYNKPWMVKADPNKYVLQLVTPAKGMSIKEFDHKVVAVAEAYFDEKPQLYLALHRNCNTTTSTILARAGGYIVPSKALWRLPGWKKW